MTAESDRRFVVDASVALKWVIAETDSGQAELLLDHALVAPDLLFPECANALWKKVRRRELTAEEAGIAVQTLQQADLTVVSARGYIERATAISIELDHPAYDALYVAIAEAFGLRWVTADDRLVRKARQAQNRLQALMLPLSELRTARSRR